MRTWPECAIFDEDIFTATADDSWVQLIGLRNVISHGYHEIKSEQIWQIVIEELPTFATTIEDLTDRA